MKGDIPKLEISVGNLPSLLEAQRRQRIIPRITIQISEEAINSANKAFADLVESISSFAHDSSTIFADAMKSLEVDKKTRTNQLPIKQTYIPNINRKTKRW